MATSWEDIQKLPLSDTQKQQMWSALAAEESLRAMPPPVTPDTSASSLLGGGGPPAPTSGIGWGGGGNPGRDPNATLNLAPPPGAPGAPGGPAPTGVGMVPPGAPPGARGPAAALPGTPRELQELALGAARQGTAPPEGMTSQQQYGLIGTIGAQPGAGGLLKAGQSTTSQSSGMVVTPEMRKTRKDLEASQGNEAEAARAAGANAVARGEEAAAQTEAQAAELATENQRREAVAAAQAEDLAKRQKQYEEQQAEYTNASKKLDPERLMNTGSNRALAAISLALGAFGSSLTRTPNFAMEMINDAINRDYQSQKDQLSAKKEGLTLSQQSLQNVRQLYQDDQARQLAHTANMQAVWAAQARALGQKQGGQEKRDQAEQVATGLETSAKEKSLAAQHAEARHVANSTTTTWQAGPTAEQQRSNQLDMLAKEAKTYAAQVEAFGPKLSEQERTVAKEAQQKVSQALAFMNQSQELVDHIKAGNGRAWNNPEYNSLLLSVKAQMLQAESGKAASDKERAEAAERIEGRWYQLSDADKIAAIRATQRALNQGVRANLAVVRPELKAGLRNMVEQSGFNQGQYDAIERGTEYVPRSDSSRAGEYGGTTRR